MPMVRSDGRRRRPTLPGPAAAAGLVVGLLLLMLAEAAPALEPSERLTDPALEERARDISAELRCLVCPNQSIDDSNAPLARDLRVLVRERLEAGDSDDEVMAFVTDRYGDFVRLNPPFQPNTWLLWLGPAGLLLLGAAAVAALAARRRRAAAEVPLTDEERQRLAALLDDGRRP